MLQKYFKNDHFRPKKLRNVDISTFFGKDIFLMKALFINSVDF